MQVTGEIGIFQHTEILIGLIVYYSNKPSLCPQSFRHFQVSRLNGAEWISEISFPPWFQAKGWSANAGHWRETYRKLKEEEMTQCRPKPILKFLWREGGKWIDEEEGKNYKNECVPKIHLEARPSVCGQKFLFCSRCCVSGSCVSVSAFPFSPNHQPVLHLCKQLPQDRLLNIWKKALQNLADTIICLQP